MERVCSANSTARPGQGDRTAAVSNRGKVSSDVQARWTKKHGKSYFGFKLSSSVDRRHKLIRCVHVSTASENVTLHVERVLGADKPLSGCQERNRRIAKVRARVEHVVASLVANGRQGAAQRRPGTRDAAPELEGGGVQPVAPVHVEGGWAGALLTPEMGLESARAAGSARQSAEKAPRRHRTKPYLGPIAASPRRAHLKAR